MTIDPRITALLGHFPAGEQALRSGIVCRPIVAGAVNSVIRVTADGCDWAVRMSGGDDQSLIVSREGEYRAHTAAATLGIAPAVVYAAPEAGVLVSEWIDAPVASPELFRTARGLGRVGRQLRCLHDAPVPSGLRRIDPLALVDDYLRGGRAGTGPVSLRVIETALVQIGALRICDNPLFCHNDLHHLNVLDSDRLWFLDWEYAGCGDPRFDLAGVVAYHDLEWPQVEALLGGYGNFDPREIAPWVTLFDVVHALWLDAADAWDSLSGTRRIALLSRLGA